jgi:hypothetical protein
VIFLLAAHNAVIQSMKPGVKWPDMHRLAGLKNNFLFDTYKMLLSCCKNIALALHSLFSG